MPLTICTFNVNNLFARYRFDKNFPGDRAKKSLVDNNKWGYLPQYQKGFMEIFNEQQRRLEAEAITCQGTLFPDVVCLQEVESLLALRTFSEDYLGNRYRHAVLIDSRDFRQIDVALLTNLDIINLRSHVDDPDPLDAKFPWLFSRDCLEVELLWKNGAARTLTLFINHFKSKMTDTPAKAKDANDKRERQADAVREIIRKRFPDPQSAYFAVVGDFNDQPGSKPVQPLETGSGLVDVVKRHISNPADRWTHWWRGKNIVSQLDYVLASPALASKITSLRIERRGIGLERILSRGGTGPVNSKYFALDSDPNPATVGFQFTRFPKVTTTDYASDHCPVFFTIG